MIDKTEIEALNLEINSFKRIASRYTALERLLQNKDFQDVILDGFVNETSNKIFNQLILPVKVRTIDKETCDSTLNAIAMINKYIGVGEFKGDLYYDALTANDRILELEDYLRNKLVGK